MSSICRECVVSLDVPPPFLPLHTVHALVIVYLKYIISRPNHKGTDETRTNGTMGLPRGLCSHSPTGLCFQFSHA